MAQSASLRAANERTRRAARAWRSRPNPGEPYIGSTPSGTVLLEALSVSESDGLEVLEIRVGGKPSGGDPHFRIVNPPTLIKDASGAWVEDPLAAIAEAIGGAGGAAVARQQSRKRGQR